MIVEIAAQRIVRIPRLRLESGVVLEDIPVAYETWGTLNETRDNVLVICHALTGSADVADWWGPLLGPGKAFDTQVFFVVCANVLGSPYGTASSLTHGIDFPSVTIRDTVRLHWILWTQLLGIRRVQAVIGGSMGGMQALEYAFLPPTDSGDPFARTLIAIATSGRHSAWCISWSEAQRQAIMSDQLFKDGRYSPDLPPIAGLTAARMQALLTYRSRQSFERRFGRRLSPDSSERQTHLFSAQSYLRYQGEKFIRRFDANCYISLTYMMDSHDLGRDRRGGYEAALRSIRQPCLLVGIDSDGLFPVVEQQELHRCIPQSSLEIIESDEGHDGFLLEFEQMNNCLTNWLEHQLPDYRDALLDSRQRFAAALSRKEASAEPVMDFKVKKESVFGEAEVRQDW